MSRPEKRRRQAKLRDVAALAKVSQMTVSNVVNGRYGAMSQETRERIERAIAELNYRPRSAARGLRSDRCFCVGMLIVDRAPTYLADPWITQLVAGLSNQLSSHGYSLLVHGTPVANLANSSMLHHVATDGLCVLLSGRRRERNLAIDMVRNLGQPVILFQEVQTSKSPDLCVLRQDDRGGGEMLGKLLLSLGARRLLILESSWEWPALKERSKGVRAAIRRFGDGGEFKVLGCGMAGFSETVERFRRHLAKHDRPDAVLGGNDQMGIAAMKVLQDEGVNVPGEVMVTGFNAFDFWAYSSPVLTTVRSPAYALGAKGGEIMIARLAGGRLPESELVLPVELQLGETTLSPLSTDK